MEKNYVIEFENWDSYNTNSKEEAIEEFKKDYPNARIINVRG